MKALPLGNSPIEHSNVFDFRIRAGFFIAVSGLYARLIGACSKNRVRVDAIGYVL
jgi:hypothetical protein